MKYNSVVFREFTQESIKRIANERSKQQRIDDDHTEEESDANKQPEDKRTAYKPKPDKELAVGEKLPQILQRKFPLELIGKPIEEIDLYYRTEYVCIIFFKDRIIFLNNRFLWLLTDLTQYFDLAQHRLFSYFLHLIAFAV